MCCDAACIHGCKCCESDFERVMFNIDNSSSVSMVEEGKVVLVHVLSRGFLLKLILASFGALLTVESQNRTFCVFLFLDSHRRTSQQQARELTLTWGFGIANCC